VWLVCQLKVLAMIFALWAWFLALFVNTADTVPGPRLLYNTAKYKTFYIEQPVSIKIFFCYIELVYSSTVLPSPGWFWLRIAPHTVHVKLHMHMIPRWKQLANCCILTQFACECERTRGAWIQACDTTMQYGFLLDSCDVILLCTASQISNKK